MARYPSSTVRLLANARHVARAPRRLSCLVSKIRGINQKKLSYSHRKREPNTLDRSTRCSERAWQVDEFLDKWADESLTQPKGNHALDYNCHPSRALASGLYRPLWRRFDPSSARHCRHRARYSADSRQTRALSNRFSLDSRRLNRGRAAGSGSLQRLVRPHIVISPVSFQRPSDRLTTYSVASAQR